MAKNKLSFDVYDENKDILEKLKHEHMKPYGAILNNLIDVFCKLPLDIKNELFDFVTSQIEELYTQMDYAGTFEKQSLVSKAQSYMKIARFLNNNHPISIDSINKKPKMQKIPVKNGVLICPSDFIILNIDAAQKSEHASVVEIRNSVNVPHFLFFTNRTIDQYDEKIYSIIYDLCRKEWPHFQDIIDKQVEPIPDPDNIGRYLNAKEYLAAPQIGHFAVYTQGDPSYPSNYQPPMGTCIIKSR